MLKVLRRTQHQGPAVRKDLANGTRRLIPCVRPTWELLPPGGVTVQTAIVHKSLRGGRCITSFVQSPLSSSSCTYLIQGFRWFPAVCFRAKLATASKIGYGIYIYAQHTHTQKHTGGKDNSRDFLKCFLLFSNRVQKNHAKLPDPQN